MLSLFLSFFFSLSHVRTQQEGAAYKPVRSSSVQSLSRVRLFATPWIAALQASLSITNSNSCPSSQWCHPAISSSVVPFSSCPQSFPASGSFPMSQLFISGGQSTGVSASASVLPMNTCQGMFNSKIPVCCFLSLLSPLFLISPCQGREKQASLSQDGDQRGGMLA